MEAQTRRLLDELVQNLECPICFELPTEPIFTCVVGHLICKRCHGLISSCPLCRGKLLGTRSFIAEKSVSVVSHLIRGTGTPQPDIVESSAQQICGIGLPVRCSLAVNGCRNKLLDAGSYIEHLKAKHAALVVHSASGMFSHKTSIAPTGTIFVKRGVDRLFIMEVTGRSFIINMCQEGKEVRIWAETEIRPNDATANQTVRISLLDAEDVRIVSWSGPINGLHVTDRSVAISGNCLKLTTEQMKAALQNDDLSPTRFWKLQVEIQNPKVNLFQNSRQLRLGILLLGMACTLLLIILEFFMFWKYGTFVSSLSP